MARIYRIHPSIGISRLGNSRGPIMYAPEMAQGVPTEIVGGEEGPVVTMRDSGGAIRREACRFRIWQEDTEEPGNYSVVKIGRDDGLVDIEWTVWLANKKAQWYKFDGLQGENPSRRRRRNGHIRSAADRRKLIIDPGPRSVSATALGRTAEFNRSHAQSRYPVTFPPSLLYPYRIDTLGSLSVDQEGTLSVIPAFGAAGSTDSAPAISDYANNDYWFDDVADGPVSATLVFSDGTREIITNGAWVICAPPAYAPEIGNVVTLYDVLFDVAVRHLGYREDLYRNERYLPNYQVDFRNDLADLFQRIETVESVERRIPSSAHLLNWQLMQEFSPSAERYRQLIFDVIRGPNDSNTTHSPSGRLMMPYALGDDPYRTGPERRMFLTVTATQHFLLNQWVKGLFFTDGTTREGPMELDRGPLNNCVGGAFFPGIETTWIVRNLKIYVEPFRIRHRDDVGPGLHLHDDLDLGLEAGDLTKRMAIPWQADFNECARERRSNLDDVAWWPAQRPLSVLDSNFQRVEWSRGITPGTRGDIEMVRNWKNLGFVSSRRVGGNVVFVERERNPF